MGKLNVFKSAVDLARHWWWFINVRVHSCAVVLENLAVVVWFSLLFWFRVPDKRSHAAIK